MSQASKLSSSDALRGLRPDQVNRDPGDETAEVLKREVEGDPDADWADRMLGDVCETES